MCGWVLTLVHLGAGTQILLYNENPVIYMQGFGLRQVLLAFKFSLKMTLNCVLTL